MPGEVNPEEIMRLALVPICAWEYVRDGRKLRVFPGHPRAHDHAQELLWMEIVVYDFHLRSREPIDSGNRVEGKPFFVEMLSRRNNLVRRNAGFEVIAFERVIHGLERQRYVRQGIG